MFRDECLPVFFGEPLPGLFPDYVPERIRLQMVDAAGRLSSWREAVSRLTEFLPLELVAREMSPPRAEEFNEWLFSVGTAAVSVDGGRILWAIIIFPIFEMAVNWCKGAIEWTDDPNQN